MLHEEITQDIIGSSMVVLNALKPGLDEKLYENAMVLELQARGHTINQQREYPVQYRGQLIGTLIPDLIVDDKVIADPKVVSAFNETHVAQMIGYLNITNLKVAILLSFKEAQLRWKRIANERGKGITQSIQAGQTTAEEVNHRADNPGAAEQIHPLLIRENPRYPR